MIRLTFTILFFSLASNALAADAINIGPGDIFRQPTDSPFLSAGLNMTGGRMLNRSDGMRTHFTGGQFNISGGQIDANLILDNPTVRTEVSGGTFNDPLLIARGPAAISGGTFNDIVQFNSHGEEISGGVFNSTVKFQVLDSSRSMHISGGTFNNTVDFDRFQGSVRISGGDFQNGIILDPSFTDSARPTLFIAGKRWTLNGERIAFQNNVADLLDRFGLLE